jgi:glycine/D-amino acid oxidase-like deaminating enzyme
VVGQGQAAQAIPHLKTDGRYPVIGAFVQPRAGTARHDAVNWGYARAADALGVDIIQNCEVQGFQRSGGRITGVETNRGFIAAEKVGLAVAGSTSLLAEKAGLGRLPIETHKLQAYVSEPLKPFLDCVLVYGVGHGHFYISQSDKGGLVFGGDLDFYNSYAQSGNLPRYQDVMGCAMNVLPAAGRIKLLRQWAGIMDMSMDGSPFITDDRHRGPLSQRRLVLWRVQGHARLGLVLRPHHRRGPPARDQRAADALALRRGAPDRRDRAGGPVAEPPLRGPASDLGRALHDARECRQNMLTHRHEAPQRSGAARWSNGPDAAAALQIERQAL